MLRVPTPKPASFGKRRAADALAGAIRELPAVGGERVELPAIGGHCLDLGLGAIYWRSLVRRVLADD
eukprot:2699044-Lingulodinium_polyedra.AAC.1